MVEIKKYDNGLRLVVDYIDSVNSVASGIMVKMGSSNESPDINGLSHFTEHMIYKGTDKYSSFEIADKFESLGAQINAFTAKETTCYHFKSIDEHKEECFELLSHIFLDSIFDNNELDKERKVIFEEINMTEDSGEDICYDLSCKAQYGDSMLGQTILGSYENVGKFKQNDVVSFTKKHYCASNVVVSFAGKITMAEADKFVQKYIIKKISTQTSDAKTTEKISLQRNHKERIKDFEQSTVILAFEGLPLAHKKSNDLILLNIILGGSMSSRLFQSIREELGLAYNVFSSASSNVNNGALSLCLNISKESTSKALDATANEIKKILSGDIRIEELNRAKTQVKTTLAFSRENIMSIMVVNAKMLTLTNEIIDISTKMEHVSKVTLDDINDIAKKIFVNDKIYTAYVGREHTADFSKFNI